MPISYPRRMVDDLRKVSEISAENFSAAMEVANRLEEITIRPSVLEEELRDVIGQEHTSALLKSAFAISNLYSIEKEPNIDLVISRVVERSDIDVEKLSGFKKFIGLRVVRNCAKALYLSYEQENIFLNARSIVDIRPVFDEEKASVVGNIILPIIKITYMDSSQAGSRDIFLSLDEGDVKTLAEMLSETVQKIRLLRESSLTFDDAKSFVAGEEVAKQDV